MDVLFALQMRETDSHNFAGCVPSAELGSKF